MGQTKIGAMIALGGEKKFRSAIAGINSDLKTLKSETALVQEKFSGQANTLEALRQKHEALSKVIKKQEEKQEQLKNALDNAKKSQTNVGTGLEELRKKHQEASDAMKKMESSSDTTAEELENQRKKVEELSEAINRGESNYELAQRRINQWQTSLNNSESELIRMRRELDQTERYMDEANSSADRCADSIDEFGNQVREAESETKSFGTAVQVALGNLAASAIEKCFSEIADLTKQAISGIYEVGSSFESQMSTVEALSGAGGSALESLNEKAKDIGATTKFTATQAAEGLEYMALAGWNVNEMLDGIDGVISATAASGLELGQVSDILTDSMTAFGDSAADANRYADVLATTQAKSNTTIAALGEAYANCAATAGAYGYSLESVSAGLGLLANAGIKGAVSGTNLSIIMSRLATNTGGARDMMESLGVEFYNTDGSARDFDKVIVELCTAMSGMTTEEKASISTVIAGKNAQKSLNAIINQGAEAYSELYNELSNCDGAAESMAETMNDNLNGKLTIMQSSLEAVGLSIFEYFQEPLKEAVEEGTQGFESLNDAVAGGPLADSLKELGKETGELAKKAIDFAIKAVPKITNGLSWVIDHGDEIVAILKGIGAGMAAMAVVGGITKAITLMADMKKVILGITASIRTMSAARTAATVAQQAETAATEAATVAQQGLNTAQKASPIGLIISLLVGAGVALYSYAKSAGSAKNASQELIESMESQREAIESNVKSHKDSVDNTEAEWIANERLIDKLYELDGIQEKTTAQKSEMKGLVEQLAEDIPELTAAYDEETGSINMTEEAVRKLMAAKKDYAMAQAYQSMMQDIAKDAADTELAITKVDGKLEELKASLKDMGMDYDKDELTKDYLDIDWHEADKILDQIKDLEEERGELENTLSQVNEEFDDAESMVNQYADALDGAQTSIVQFSLAEQGAAANTYQMTEEQAEAYENLHQSISDSIEGAISVFDEFSGGTEITAEKVRDNLQSQIDGVTSWSDNMKTLAGAAGKGMTQEFYEYLSEMGPQSANLVQSLVDSLNGDSALFTEICQKWTQAMNLEGPMADKIAAASTMLEMSAEEMRNYNWSILDSISKETADIALQTGKDQAKAQGEGIESESEWVKRASRESLEAAKEEGEDSKEDFYNLGTGLMAGLAEGISSGEKTVSESVVAVLDSAEASARKAAQTHSPSVLYRDQIGLMISRGLAAGILSGKPEAKRSISEVCSAIFGASQQALDIHSPSRLFKDKVGAQISNGVAFGIRAKKGTAVKDAKSLADDVYKAASTWIKSYKKTHVVSLNDEKDFWTRVAQTTKEGTKAHQRALNKAANIESFQSEMQGSIEKAFGVSWFTESSKGEKEQKSAEDYYSDLYSAASKYFDNYGVLHNVSLAQEEYYWKEIRSQMGEGTQGYIDATKQLKSVQEKIKQQEKSGRDAKKKTAETKKQYALSGDALSKYKTYYEVSAKAETQYWNIVRKKFKKGTAERIEADQKYYEAKENYTKQLESLNEEYYENCRQTNEKLEEDINDLQDAYKEAVASRKSEIYSSFNLFDQFESTSSSGRQLLYNLKTQVAGIADWESQLAKLGGKNILSDGLLEELQKMGPQASASIHALNQLTEEELLEYEKLWEKKNELAESQAVKENEALRTQTESQIEELKAAAQKQINTYKDEYEKATGELSAAIEAPLQKLAKKATTIGENTASKLVAGIKKKATKKDTKADLKKVTDTVSDGLGKLPAAGKTIGDNTLQGIIDGLTNKKKIQSSAKSMIEALKKSLQAAADIHSPSRLFKKEIGVQLSAGVAEGIRDETVNVSAAGGEMIKKLLEQSKEELSRQQAAIGNYADMMNGGAGIAELNRLLSVRPVQQINAVMDNSKFVMMFEEMLAVMQDGFDRMSNLQVVMANGTLVGELHEGMSEQFALMARRLRR